MGSTDGDRGDEPTPATSSRRVSITKTQRDTEAAIELISICQTYTADGSLSPAEIEALRNWLDENRTSDLPAIGFLLEVVAKAISDGHVTSDEQREVYKALERVLPTDLRKDASDRRRTADAAARQARRKEAERTKLAERQEQDRDRPIERLEFYVAGTRYEGRPSIIAEHVRRYDLAYLRRDPENVHSKNAIAVLASNGMPIGFVPEALAVDVAPILDGGALHSAEIRWVSNNDRYAPSVHLVAWLYRPDSRTTGAISQEALATVLQPTQIVEAAFSTPPSQSHLNRIVPGHQTPAPTSTAQTRQETNSRAWIWAVVIAGVVIAGLALR